MKIELAGLRFEVGSEGGLSPVEIEALLTLGGGDSLFTADTDTDTFQMELISAVKYGLPDEVEGITGFAEITSQGSLVIVSHSQFVAELEPIAHRGRLIRDPKSSAALEITLRTALCCALPIQGGLALHAAGFDLDGRGMVFFGPSGAGKTTLARSSPYPVFSDELVAVTGPPWTLHSTGVWGELGQSANQARQSRNLSMLAELTHGGEFELEALGRQEALRRLLGVVVLPPSIPLWTEATRILRDLVTSVPVGRLRWSPADPPWVQLNGRLLGTIGQPCENSAVGTRRSP